MKHPVGLDSLKGRIKFLSVASENHVSGQHTQVSGCNSIMLDFGHCYVLHANIIVLIVESVSFLAL